MNNPNLVLLFDRISHVCVCVLVAQLCMTVCDSMNCSLPGKNTGVGCQFSSPGDLPNPGIELRSPALQASSLPSKPPGKLKISHTQY